MSIENQELPSYISNIMLPGISPEVALIDALEWLESYTDLVVDDTECLDNHRFLLATIRLERDILPCTHFQKIDFSVNIINFMKPPFILRTPRYSYKCRVNNKEQHYDHGDNLSHGAKPKKAGEFDREDFTNVHSILGYLG